LKTRISTPLARAALADYRIPMMELLVSLGADVNAPRTKPAEFLSAVEQFRES
jgi:hypothetical protein